jgi:hypothetical protein
MFGISLTDFKFVPAVQAVPAETETFQPFNGSIALTLRSSR